MTSFKDNFSKQSQGYAKYRPNYPDELFAWLAGQTMRQERAWDVGTGSGQAAIALAQHFKQVIATDPAEAQLRQAVAHERVLYKAVPAERTDIESASVDLVTVAQALHWFDFDRFYREVKRVMRPDGAIAVWAYGLHQITPEVDSVIDHYYREVVGPFWPPERRYIDEGYRTIAFPFSEISSPSFSMSAQWDLYDLIGYLDTWSAAQRYQQTKGHDPIDLIRDRLQKAWGAADVARLISWPIYLRVGTPRD